MKTILSVSLVIFSCLCFGQVDGGSVLTPDQVYYKMLHSDSVFTRHFESLDKYANLRNASKSLELSGILLGVLTTTLTLLDYPSGISASPAPTIMYGASGALGLSGWIVDWVAIKKIQPYKPNRYPQTEYTFSGFRNNRKYWKRGPLDEKWIEITEEEYRQYK